MKNNYFQFKQFTIQQEGAGMKVTTEACLFGAVVIKEKPNTILDAGSGTGILSLMLAQRFTETKITAIDIDSTAAFLSKQNLIQSPFSDRLTSLSGDYADLSEGLFFDAIVCNPPFYKTGFLSPKQERNIAMRDASTFDKVLDLFSNHLNNTGQAWILLPPNEYNEFEILAKNKNLFCMYKIHVENMPGKLFRIIAMFSKTETECKEEQICICNDDRSYTNEFKNLLKDFYLAF